MFSNTKCRASLILLFTSYLYFCFFFIWCPLLEYNLCNQDAWFLCNYNSYFTGCLLLFLSNIQEQGRGYRSRAEEERRWWWISWDVLITCGCCSIWVIYFSRGSLLLAINSVFFRTCLLGKSISSSALQSLNLTFLVFLFSSLIWLAKTT